jgi:hypothetical protein
VGTTRAGLPATPTKVRSRAGLRLTLDAQRSRYVYALRERWLDYLKDKLRA